MCSLQGQEPVVFPALPESKGERGKRGGGGGGDIGRTERHWVWGGNPHRERETRGKGGGGWMKAILCIHLALISQKERVMVRQETEGLLFLALLGIQSDWPIFSPLLWIFPCLYPVHSHFKSQEPAFIFFRQTGRQLKVLCHHFIFYFLSPSYLYFFFAHMVCQCHVLPSVDYQALNLIPSVDTQFWLAARFQFLKMDT